MIGECINECLEVLPKLWLVHILRLTPSTLNRRTYRARPKLDSCIVATCTKVDGIQPKNPLVFSGVDKEDVSLILQVVCLAPPHQVIIEISGRIDNADPCPVLDILPNAVLQELRLSATRRTNHVHAERTSLL